MWNFIAVTAVFVASFVILASGCNPRTPAEIVNAVNIPSAIAVPSGNQLHLAVRGVGHQHYAFNGSQWVLQRATATLFTIPDNRLFGKHFFLPEKDANGGQPSWMSRAPKSLITAKNIAETTVDQDSVTWNLLGETSESGDKTLLGDVTFVQRLKTHRGNPPMRITGVQTNATHASAYSAIYAFYVKE